MGVMFAFLSMMGKFELNGELFKLLQTKLETISKFFLNYFDRIITLQANNLRNLFKLCPW